MVFIKSSFALVALFSAFAFSAPVRREVPQEHSHEPILTKVRTSLNLNNPDKIVDPVFALLGNAAAAAGAGDITVSQSPLSLPSLRHPVLQCRHVEPRLLAAGCRRPGLYELQGCG